MFARRSRILACLAVGVFAPSGLAAAELVGKVVDAETGGAVACRLYLRDAEGEWHFARSGSKAGRAVEYRKRRGARSGVDVASIREEDVAVRHASRRDHVEVEIVGRRRPS